MTAVEDAVAKLLTSARHGCDCLTDRKPCTYHDGMLDGADLALTAIRTVTVAELHHWWTGADKPIGGRT